MLSPTGTTPKDTGTATADYPQTPHDYSMISWRTFPVRRGQKTPLVNNWQDSDEAVGPLDNIGVVTGLPSGIVVLDVDDRHGGAISLMEMEKEHGKLPDTLRSSTANGGAHFFFAHPGGREVRNGTAIYGKPGLDVRGDGGYVVVPPSRLDSGAYHWDVGSPMVLAPAPEWLITHGENRVKAVESGPDKKNPPGTHHDAMVRVAGALRHFGTPPESIERMLLEYNQAQNDPPCSEKDVLLVARSSDKWPQEHKPEAPARPLSLSIPASEFVSIETKPVEWLIRNIWPEEAVGFIAGMGKSFKSFLALELAYSIASGAKFLERFDVPKPQRVLLIQQESSFGAFQVRVANVARRLGATENLYIVSNKHLSLESKVDVERIEHEIARVQPSLVVLDPLASFLHGDENSAQNMGEVVGTLRKIRDDHGCGIVVVHHNRKDGTSMRGSTALYNAFEVMIKMNRTADRDSLTSEVNIELKESEGPLPFTVTLDSETTALHVGEKVEEEPDTYQPPEQQSMEAYYNQDPEENDREFERN